MSVIVPSSIFLPKNIGQMTLTAWCISTIPGIYSFNIIQKISRKRNRCNSRPFNRCKRQISHAFSLLSSLHNYSLDGFLFKLDQSNVCRDIQKIEYFIRVLTNFSKDIQTHKEALNSWWSWKVFSRISCFYRFHRATNSKAYW